MNARSAVCVIEWALFCAAIRSSALSWTCGGTSAPVSTWSPCGASPTTCMCLMPRYTCTALALATNRSACSYPSVWSSRLWPPFWAALPPTNWDGARPPSSLTSSAGPFPVSSGPWRRTSGGSSWPLYSTACGRSPTIPGTASWWRIARPKCWSTSTPGRRSPACWRSFSRP